MPFISIKYTAKRTSVEADIVDLSGPRSGNVLADVDVGCHYCACLPNIGAVEGIFFSGCGRRCEDSGSKCLWKLSAIARPEGQGVRDTEFIAESKIANDHAELAASR